jgi:hypothetical protein
MNQSQPIPWKRLLVEATAIVGSILLAFSIDAWWDDRQLVSEERDILQSLLDDLIALRSQMVNERRYNEAILNSTVELIRAGNRPELDLSGDQIDELIEDTRWTNNGADLTNASLQSILSGDFSTVTDPSVRQSISNFRTLLARAQAFYDVDSEFIYKQYTPYLVKHAFLPQLAVQSDHAPGDPELTLGFPEIDLVTYHDHSKLIHDREFQNMLFARMDISLDILNNIFPRLESSLSELIILLEQEVAK